MKLEELFTNPERWCKGFQAVNANGRPVRAVADNAVAWCIAGALYKCYPKNEDWHAVQLKLRERINGQRLHDWNDNPKTTFADVRKLINGL
jgi:hypothetical protein